MSNPTENTEDYIGHEDEFAAEDRELDALRAEAFKEPETEQPEEPAAEEPAAEEPAAEEPAAEEPAAEEPAAEEPVAEAPAEPEDSHDNNPTIPRKRLNQEIAKRRVMEQELAQLRQEMQNMRVSQAKAAVPSPHDHGTSMQPATPPKVELDFGDDVSKMFDSVLDGDSKAAAQMMQQMLQAAVQKGVETAASAYTPQSIDPDQIAARTMEQIQAQQRQLESQKMQEAMQLKVVELTHEFPILDNTREDVYDSELVDEINAYHKALVEKGQPYDVALDKAARTILIREGIYQPQQRAAAPQPAAPSQRAVDVEAKMAAAQSQPTAQAPKTPQAEPNKLKPIHEMSEEEFDALTPAELDRYKGIAS